MREGDHCREEKLLEIWGGGLTLPAFLKRFALSETFLRLHLGNPATVNRFPKRELCCRNSFLVSFMWSNVGCGFGQKNHYVAGVLQQHVISVVAANDQQYKLQNEAN